MAGPERGRRRSVNVGSSDSRPGSFTVDGWAPHHLLTSRVSPYPRPGATHGWIPDQPGGRLACSQCPANARKARLVKRIRTHPVPLIRHECTGSRLGHRTLKIAADWTPKAPTPRPLPAQVTMYSKTSGRAMFTSHLDCGNRPHYSPPCVEGDHSTVAEAMDRASDQASPPFFFFLDGAAAPSFFWCTMKRV